MYTKPMEETGSGNGAPPTTAHQDAVARAMAASRRLIDAAAKARDAYVEACQESVEACQETLMEIPGLEESFAASAPADWSKLLGSAGLPPSNPLNEEWQKSLLGPVKPDEWVAAGKRACLEYIDTCEQALLAAIDVRERMGEASNIDWIQSAASTRAGVERDVAKACLASARRLLN
jgi:hypothetical protein